MAIVFSAFLMGLFGLVHCISMCGSLSVALGFSIPKHRSFVKSSILISFGRITSYAVVGGLVNWLAMSMVTMTDGGILFLRLLSSVLMIGIGIHIMGVSNAISKIEVIGRYVDLLLTPIKKKLLPIDSNFKCLAYGLFWGFLPCGLVYTALTLAFTAPNVLVASLTMFAFGLGTLPALIGMTSFNAKLSSVLKLSAVRFLFGTLIIFMAIWQGWQSKLLITGI